jgi:hypothetical protein
MDRVKELVSNFDYTDQDKNLILKIIEKHNCIRNDFYHDIKKEMDAKYRKKLDDRKKR